MLLVLKCSSDLEGPAVPFDRGLTDRPMPVHGNQEPSARDHPVRRITGEAWVIEQEYDVAVVGSRPDTSAPLRSDGGVFAVSACCALAGGGGAGRACCATPHGAVGGGCQRVEQ